MKLKRPLVGPDHPHGPSRGRDVRDFVKRTLHRLPAQVPVGEDFFPKPVGGFDDVYNEKTEDAIDVLRHLQGRKRNRPFAQDDLDALWEYADPYAKWVYRIWRAPKEPVIPDLGPVWAGGPAVLDHDLTHATSGIPLFPAFDDAFVEGREIIAPEDIEVIPNPRTGAPWSSSSPGKAFYARGMSGIEYWFGHLDRNHPVGIKFRKGRLVGKVAPNAIGGGPHVHVGINAEALLGKGRELKHRTDYRHGAPLIREQLASAGVT